MPERSNAEIDEALRRYAQTDKRALAEQEPKVETFLSSLPTGLVNNAITYLKLHALVLCIVQASELLGPYEPKLLLASYFEYPCPRR